MKSLLMTSALAIALAAPAFAEEATTTEKPAATTTTETTKTTTSSNAYYTEAAKTDFLASKLMGARVYATQAEVDTTKPVDKVTTEWSDIGEINNIVLDRDGKVKAVVLGVGGFLGIGEKDVAVRMSELKFVKKAGDSDNDWFIVVKGDKQSLEAAPTYKPMT